MRPEIPKGYLAALLALPVVLFLIVDTVPRFIFASCSYYVTCDPETFSVTASPQEIALNETSDLEGFNAECPCSWSIDSQPGGWEVVAGTDCTATLKPISTFGEAGTVVVRSDSGQYCSEAVSVETGVSTFRVQGSIDGGSSWASDELIVNGKPGEPVDLALRVNMNVTNNPSQGWSYSMKHDTAQIFSGGGALDIMSVTTDGTHTATVQATDPPQPPDFEETQIRQDAQAQALGFIQGIVIDQDQTALTLDPVLDFVTAGACYHLTVPAEGTYSATFSLTNDIGDGRPPIECVITQHGQDTYPKLRGFTLTVNSHSSFTTPPGSCDPAWVTANDGIATPLVETFTLPQSASDAVTERLPPGMEPDDDSRDARITPDGRFVVFASRATNLIEGTIIPGRKLQIYRFERQSGSVVHVSKKEEPPDNPPAADDCFHPSISDDGQKIAFASLDDDLTENTNHPTPGCCSDVHLRDLDAGETRLLSVTPGGESPWYESSFLPSISGDGEFVAFTSEHESLDACLCSNQLQCPPDPVPDPCPPQGSHFVYRVHSSATATRFVSFTPGGIPFDAAATGHIEPSDLWVPPNAPLVAPTLAGIVGDAINSNGDAVVFQAWRFTEGFDFTEWHIFLRDFEPEEMEPMMDPATLQASVDVPFQNGNAFARRPTIGRDTTRLAYGIRSPEEDILNEQVNFEDISRDGAGLRTITPGPAGAVGVGDGDSKMPMLSEDGRFATFTSVATDLIPGETDGQSFSDVFLVDLEHGQPKAATRRESVDSTGGEADMDSLNSDLAIADPQAPGSIVVFESDATDLILSDTNGKRDIFERMNNSETVHFVRGDVNSDDTINLTDAINVLTFLFQDPEQAPKCFDAADADDNGKLNITDPINVLQKLFVTGDPLPEPFPDCGTDPRGDDLDCQMSSTACSS